MGNPDKAKWIAGPAASFVVRYGVAVVSVAVAAGLAQAFLFFHFASGIQRPPCCGALSAIAIAFWYGGTKPGILAAVLSALVRSFIFDPEIKGISSVLYDLVFLVFALLMTGVIRARDELEMSVAKRTAELTARANEVLSHEIAERKHAEEKLRRRASGRAFGRSTIVLLTHTGSWVWQWWREETPCTSPTSGIAYMASSRNRGAPGLGTSWLQRVPSGGPRFAVAGGN